MSMSVLSPRLQIVNGLPDSPKTEAKEALLVRGPWDETPGYRLILTVSVLPRCVVRLDLDCQPIPRRLLCYDVLTVGYPCRKGLARKAAELGGEVEH